MPQKHANSMQKTAGNRNPLQFSIYKGGYRKKSQQTAEKQKTGNPGCSFVGLGVNLRGEKGERAKKDSPNLSTQPGLTVSCLFRLLDYRALKASNHLLYSDSISNETLGFRASNIFLKSPIVIHLGLAALSIALPDSKNSPIRFN